MYCTFWIKLPPFGNRAADVPHYLNVSLDKLGLKYVDMYLIHSPRGILKNPNDPYMPAKNQDGSIALDNNTDYISTWKVAIITDVFNNFGHVHIKYILNIFKPFCINFH